MEQKTVGIYSSNLDAHTPTLAYKDDVGYDLYSVNDYEILPGEMVEVHTGIHLAMPPDLFAQINTRSSFGKKGLIVHHGVIDSGYTGPLTLWISNFVAIRDENGALRRTPYSIKKGDRVAQLLFHTAERPILESLEVLPTTERGEKKNGSSGK